MEEFQKITNQTWIYVLVNTEEIIFTLTKGQQAGTQGLNVNNFNPDCKVVWKRTKNKENSRLF